MLKGKIVAMAYDARRGITIIATDWALYEWDGECIQLMMEV